MTSGSSAFHWGGFADADEEEAFRRHHFDAASLQA